MLPLSVVSTCNRPQSCCRRIEGSDGLSVFLFLKRFSHLDTTVLYTPNLATYGKAS